MAVEPRRMLGREHRPGEEHQTVEPVADLGDDVVVRIHAAMVPVSVQHIVIGTFRLYGVVAYVSGFERIDLGMNGLQGLFVDRCAVKRTGIETVAGALVRDAANRVEMDYPGVFPTQEALRKLPDGLRIERRGNLSPFERCGQLFEVQHGLCLVFLFRIGRELAAEPLDHHVVHLIGFFGQLHEVLLDPLLGRLRDVGQVDAVAQVDLAPLDSHL